MSHRIKVTGYIEIEDDEFDPGPSGPLTEKAYLEYTGDFAGLDDLDFEEDAS